uniref:Uncharacterized protein n=1 Tax=Pyramimonas obovata TaxID=1411642 RepID=A0A7S0N3F9_9CHLO|mmetsp:Transcript_18078/g.39532  ORF Transcript_18078/g.39532 Transcript_18078/m.39532 type:complete len:212 (+) Transcript_18078:72-707(+)
MLRAVASRHSAGVPPLVQLCRNFRSTLNARATGVSEGAKAAAGKTTKPNAAAAENPLAPESAPANPLGTLMFPWERTVLDGERATKTTMWGKAYWAVFSAAFLLVVYNRASDYYKEKNFVEDPEVVAKKKQRLKASVQGALDGQSFVASSGDDDPFDGLTPEEITAMVEKEAGKSGDVFEGMSPEEINAYMAKQQTLNKAEQQTAAYSRRL